MFESLDNRRRGPSLWKAFGITCSLFSLFVILYLHFRDAHDQDEAERRHEEYKAASEARDQPHRVERGGIAVEVPAEPMHQGDYNAGGMVGNNFEVTWNLGAAWPPAEADKHAQDFAAKHLGFAFKQTHDFKLAGAAARAYELQDGDRHIYLAYSTCAGRRIHLLVYDDRKLFESMTHTFECVPDKTVDLARRDVVVDAVTGWKRVDPDERGLALENAAGVRVTTWLLRREYGKAIADIIGPAVAEAGLSLRDKPTTRNDKILYSAYYEDGSQAYLLAFRCPDDDIGVVIVSGPKDHLDDGVTLADTAHCLLYEQAMPVY
ncbi:MAG: hypothetical protein ABJE66_01855 [Deltaproteobacteria bacterium]